jgi:hypothetical protein
MSFQDLAENYPLRQSSSDGEESNNVEIGSKTSLIQKLQNSVNVNHTRVTKLLHILSPYHPELPLDCRTLLKTPKSATTQKLETGELIYFLVYWKVRSNV